MVHSKLFKLLLKPIVGYGIASKMAIIILLCSTVITLILTINTLIYDYKTELDDLEKALVQIERGYSESIAEDLWNVDHQEVKTQLEGILALKDIEFVHLSIKDFDSVEKGNKNIGNVLSREIKLLYLTIYAICFKETSKSK